MNNYGIFIIYSDDITDEGRNSIRKIINYFDLETIFAGDENVMLSLKSYENVLKTIYKLLKKLKEQKENIRICKVFSMGDVSNFTFHECEDIGSSGC